jgi:hypothetical protein
MKDAETALADIERREKAVSAREVAIRQMQIKLMSKAVEMQVREQEVVKAEKRLLAESSCKRQVSA